MSAAAAAGGAAGGAASGGEWTGVSQCPSPVASRKKKKKKGAACEGRLPAWVPVDGVRPEKRRQNTAHRQKLPLRSCSHCNIHNGYMDGAKHIDWRCSILNNVGIAPGRKCWHT